jgi:hypothetical protein
MKPTPFDEQEDLEPIPFSDDLRRLALNMKRAGLLWKPHVGCFVWDREGRIGAPSPFPRDIYFILNMNRFLAIFGSIEEMQRSLVWLPTWSQCMRVLRGSHISNPEEERAAVAETSGDLEGLYLFLIEHLQRAHG